VLSFDLVLVFCDSGKTSGNDGEEAGPGTAYIPYESSLMFFPGNSRFFK
jgi:hypothetical protein